MGGITGSSQKTSSSNWEKFVQNLFSNSTGSESGSGTQSQNPWAEQAPYLLKAFQTAQDTFNQSPQQYNGQMAADRSGMLDKALAGADQANANGNSISSILMQALGRGDQAGAAGVSSITDLIGRMSEDPNKLLEKASLNGNALANSESVTGMVDAASRDINRGLRENILPANNLAAGATGNMNSSRTAIADGLAKRGAAEAIADTSAAIRGDAFNRGFDSTLAQENANRSGIMNSAGILQTFNGLGNSAGLAANQVGSDGARLYADMAGLDTADRQRTLDGDLAKFNLNSQMPWMNMNNLWSIIGGANWGGTTTNNYANNSTDQTTTNTSGNSQGAGKSKTSGWGFSLKL